MERGRSEPESATAGAGAPGSVAVHLEELYAACCVYTGDERTGESLLREVLPSLAASPPDEGRVSFHRVAYQAAAGPQPAPTPSASSPGLRSSLAGLPLPSRAALFLVDAAGMPYTDVAAVLDVDDRDVAPLVSDGRRQLRQTLFRTPSPAARSAGARLTAWLRTD